jgi:hypothetical protein
MVVGTMDKFIYRGILILACLILAVVLIITPVLFKMYVDIKKFEARFERKLIALEKEKEK